MPLSEEGRERQRENGRRSKGRRYPNRVITPEGREVLRENGRRSAAKVRGRPHVISPEGLEALRESGRRHRGVPKTDEHKEKIGAAHRRRSEIVRAALTQQAAGTQGPVGDTVDG